jgi:hypothetical protein
MRTLREASSRNKCNAANPGKSRPHPGSLAIVASKRSPPLTGLTNHSSANGTNVQKLTADSSSNTNKVSLRA